MSAKLVIIGIDGMDPDVFETLEQELPNLHGLRSQHVYRPCASTFPPDSIPAWVTIFTGQHPAAHGWLDNIDYEDIRRGASAFDVKRLEGNTFWDLAGKEGKRVCVINPLLAYPVWPVNGIMASGPVFITGDIQTYPAELKDQYPVPQLGGMTDFPDQDDLESFVGRTRAATVDLANYGLQMLKQEDWDLFFISFFTLDRLQHFLWRYYDAGDPLYPGPTSLGAAIPESYQLFDELVGKFTEQVNADASVLVVSDHGHGPRPIFQLNVNEILRRMDILKMPDERRGLRPRQWVERLKNLTIAELSAHGLESWIYRIGRTLPKRARKSLKKSTFVIDKQASLAWASEMGGGASVGGVEINPKIERGGEVYSQLTDRIIRGLESYVQPNGERIVNWINRAGLFSDDGGRNYYPDIVFELDKRYAVGRSVLIDEIGKAPRRARVSGGHKPRGVFFLRTPSDYALPESLSVREISPLALSILGVGSGGGSARHK